MTKRPLPVTLISCLFIAAGVIGLASHLTEFKGSYQYDLIWASLVNLIAIVSGVFMLRGSNWARWLALLWIASHVILSAFHPMRELVVHSLLFVVIAYVLFCALGSRYFRPSRIQPILRG